MSTLDTSRIKSEIGKPKVSKDELLSVYKRIAKVTDQRMLRLEKLSTQKHFKGVKKYAYRKAAYIAAEWGADPDKPRYNIRLPADIRKDQIRAKIMDMLDFLDKPTSKKSDIIKIYQKRADTLNKTFEKEGLTFTWQDVGDFFESSLYKKMESGFGSSTRIKAFAQIQHDKKQVLKAFKKKSEYHIKVDDDVVQEAIDKMLSEYSSETKKLLNKIKGGKP